MYDATLKKFCSFFFLVHRKNRFYVTVGLYSNRLQKMSNVARTQVIHAAMPRVPLFCSQRI